MPFLTTTQVASWFGVSEKTVVRRVRDGMLPTPFRWRTRPRFHADIILPLLLQNDDVKFAGGVTLETDRGPIYYDVIEPTYKVDNFGEWCAVFEGRGDTWHVRPWRTAYVWMPEFLDHPDVILDCRDEKTPEIRYENLPELSSAYWQFFKTSRQRFGDFGRARGVAAGPGKSLQSPANTPPLQLSRPLPG